MPPRCANDAHWVSSDWERGAGCDGSALGSAGCCWSVMRRCLSVREWLEQGYVGSTASGRWGMPQITLAAPGTARQCPPQGVPG
ncbi:hypothetical protein ARHIZOSPH14_32780 [Agromyces rhizosphaerae]|uniref:Uncharacterized protein n=1 Tax=Agromyces rhizosphaerae TaxID=88374 RepID=A0A9W6CU18_9MICO|nr:hypothetical protein ARHIZOSPH14_32780 [Agromyces rhizosphaerae]